MTVESLIPVAYLIAAVTFILGLKGLSSPTTAVQGNRIAAGGMLIALIATFFAADVKGGVPLILAGIAVGGIAGFAGARMVKMTAIKSIGSTANDPPIAPARTTSASSAVAAAMPPVTSC